jgi:methylmalonyl-CoA mutase cobalamin-binding domain/chain
VPALVKALKDQGAEDIVVFVGGVIPAQDYDFLYKAGAAGIFGPAPHLRLRQAGAGGHQGRACLRVSRAGPR